VILLAGLLALLGPIIGCASSSTLDPPARVSRVARHPSVLTRAELAVPTAESSPTLYHALQQLRPLWLNDRGPQSFMFNHPVQVALDGQLVGDIGNLRDFRASDVEEARILNVSEAGSRYGMRAQSQRVIELTSRRGGAQ
jgi:hypothetical protein